MIITDGFEEVEAVGTYAILERGGVSVDVYSLKDSDATGRFGLTCTNLKKFSELDPDEYEAIIFPGGPEHVEVNKSPRVHELIKKFTEDDKYVCAICASPTILGKAGYLKGKRYTCFTSMNEDFGGEYVDEYTCTDGKLITGRSAAASIDFGFEILKALKGEDQEKKTKAEIYY